MKLLFILQNGIIEEKIKEAPDSAYEIGVFIGSLLPFVILVVVAFVLFRYNTNKINKQ